MDWPSSIFSVGETKILTSKSSLRLSTCNTNAAGIFRFTNKPGHDVKRFSNFNLISSQYFLHDFHIFSWYSSRNNAISIRAYVLLRIFCVALCKLDVAVAVFLVRCLKPLKFGQACSVFIREGAEIIC